MIAELISEDAGTEIQILKFEPAASASGTLGKAPENNDETKKADITTGTWLAILAGALCCQFIMIVAAARFLPWSRSSPKPIQAETATTDLEMCTAGKEVVVVQ